MAAHAPWGAGNDLPQAQPIWSQFFFFGFLGFLCRHVADIDAFIGFSRDLGIDKVCEILTVLFFPGGGSDQP